MPHKTADSSLDDLKAFLEKLFQFENADLDFGIYKILNYKRSEIQNFINNLLTQNVREQLNLLADAENQNLVKELKELEKEDVIQGYNKAVADKNETTINVLLSVSQAKIEHYQKLKDRFSLHVQTEKAESHIYKHLALFFSRYYDKGDFVSKRRYGKSEKYMIPYNGEETYFYWANADQYYIKSSEFFRKYSFKIPSTNGHTLIHFKLKDANEEQGNVRSEENKYFILSADPVEINEAEINICFEYRGITDAEKNTKGNNQSKLNEYALPLIKKALGNNTAVVALFIETDGKTKVGTELNRYTSRNKYDFFIHKNLKGFLTRELDFYIKSELLKLDDLTVFDSETHFETIRLQFNIIKTFKNIATTIIDFISQIEDFQKKLWEKKKFVIDTHYVITLDKLAAFTSDEFTDSVMKEVIANTAQVQEWKELFGEGIFADWNKITSKQTKNDETEFRKLPIDTKHFSEDFKWKLLCEISKKESLDDVINGVIFKSDNYQALQILQEKYYERIKCVYIDPPYNAKTSEILYKNSFKHSSWLTMINDRIASQLTLMKKDGVSVIAIDENEQEKLGLLLDKNFGEHSKTCVTIVHNPSGQQGDNFSYTHEFAYFLYAPENRQIGLEIRDEENSDTRNLRDVTGEDSLREAAANCFYPILVKDQKIIGFGEVCDKNFHPGSVNILRKDNVIEIYPIDPQGVERKWRFARQTIEEIKNELTVKLLKKRNIWDVIRTKHAFNFKTVWTDSKYFANNYGTQILNNILGKQLFSYPKSIYTVKDCLTAALNNENNSFILDYFGGSGTTAHAIQILNAKENADHKFLLAEQNEYFYTVIIPRIKKVSYSFDWSNGLPQNENGSGIFFKYHRLEQYEESLENIAFSNKDTLQIQLDFNDYIPKYFLNFETADSNTFMNLDAMQDPFNYELKVFNEYEYVSKKVDIVETFNYLIGLFIKGYEIATHQNRQYIFVTGADRQNKNMVVVWRSAIELDYEQDRDFIEQHLQGRQYDTLYVNGQCAVEGAQMTEEVFKIKMN